MKPRTTKRSRPEPATDKETAVSSARLAACKAVVELFDALRKNKSPEAKEEMFRIIEPFAISGYEPAMTRLSVCYREGYGVEKDRDKAIEWMERVAASGSEASVCKLFDLLMGKDTPDSKERMFRIIEPFGETGKEPARMRYAIAYLNGYGVEKDAKRATEIISALIPVDPKWESTLYQAALESYYGGEDMVESLKTMGLFDKIRDIAGSLSLFSKDYLIASLIESHLGKETTYSNILRSSSNPKDYIMSDCRILLNSMKTMKKSSLVNSSNIPKTLNAILDAGRATGEIDDDDIMSLFMSLKTEDMLSEKQRALELLAEDFDEICRSCGASYHMTHGTLLGAFRHKGFIPWDDDIDVCMLREDYERMRESCDQGTVLRAIELTKRSPDGRAWRERKVRYYGEAKGGPSIDVIVCCPVGSSDECAEGYQRIQGAYLEKTRTIFEQDDESGTDAMLDGRMETVLSEADEELNGIAGDGKRLGLAFDSPPKLDRRILLDYEDVLPPAPMEFEGMELPGPRNARKVLEAIYGSIARFPDEMPMGRRA